MKVNVTKSNHNVDLDKSFTNIKSTKNDIIPISKLLKNDCHNPIIDYSKIYLPINILQYSALTLNDINYSLKLAGVNQYNYLWKAKTLPKTIYNLIIYNYVALSKSILEITWSSFLPKMKENVTLYDKMLTQDLKLKDFSLQNEYVCIPLKENGLKYVIAAILWTNALLLLGIPVQLINKMDCLNFNKFNYNKRFFLNPHELVAYWLSCYLNENGFSNVHYSHIKVEINEYAQIGMIYIYDYPIYYWNNGKHLNEKLNTIKFDLDTLNLKLFNKK